MLLTVAFKFRESGLVVQTLKTLGREHVDQKVVERIRQHLESKAYGRLLRDTRSVTSWVYEAIKQICKEAD